MFFIAAPNAGANTIPAMMLKNVEVSHLTVVEAHVKGYGIHPYPYELEVTFNNGEKRVYLAENQH